MKDAGIKLIGPGDITQDTKLQAMGDAAVGLITMHHYNADLDNAANKRFVASWKKDYGADSTPDFMAVGGYDGMAAIAACHQGDQGQDRRRRGRSQALKGWKFDSPRGPISIDPETRDIVMNEYLVEVVKGSDGKLHQKQHRQDRQRQGSPARSRRSGPARKLTPTHRRRPPPGRAAVLL